MAPADLEAVVFAMADDPVSRREQAKHLPQDLLDVLLGGQVAFSCLMFQMTVVCIRNKRLARCD